MHSFPCRAHHHLEADLHGQRVDLGLGQPGQLDGGGLALGAERRGGGAIGRGGLVESLAERLEDFFAVLDLGQLAGRVLAKGDDLGDCLAVLALEAVDQGQAVFYLGQPLGRGVDSLGVVAQAGAEVADGGAGRGKLLRGLSEARVVVGQLLDVAQGGAQGALGRCAAFIKLIEGSHGGGVELFGVGQDAFFGLQSLVLAGDEMRGLDLLLLIAPQIDHAQAVLLALDEFVESGGSGAPAQVGLGDGFG